MIRPFSLARRLRRDERGATIVEMGFVAFPLCLTLLGLFDLGYDSYARSVLEGTVQRAARQATIGTKTTSEIDDYVKAQLATFSKGGTVEITKTNYFEYSGIGKAEKLTRDINGNGSWDAGVAGDPANKGDCYEDLNGDNKWNDAAGRNGLGGSDDIVYYTVKLTYPRIMPMDKMLGWSGTSTLQTTTVMRNQPFGTQLVPLVRGGLTQDGNCST